MALETVIGAASGVVRCRPFTVSSEVSAPRSEAEGAPGGSAVEPRDGGRMIGAAAHERERAECERGEAAKVGFMGGSRGA